MRVGIYGDSFVKSSMDWLSWPSYLSKMYDVEVYGSPGTSIEKTTQDFIENYQKYEKNVVILTEPSRVYLPNNPYFKNMYLNEIFIKNLTKDIDKKDQKEILDYFHFHIKYVNDADINFTKYLAYRNFIKSFNTDVLIIPAFRLEKANEIIPLVEISVIDTTTKTSYAKKLETLCTTDGDPRPCHMSVTNNFIFANKVARWIRKGKFKHSKKDYVVSPTYEDLFENLLDNT